MTPALVTAWRRRVEQTMTVVTETTVRVPWEQDDTTWDDEQLRRPAPDQELKKKREDKVAWRMGQARRGIPDRYVAFNADTIDSEDPRRTSGIVTPARLHELLRMFSQGGASVVAILAHRWSFSGQLTGSIEGYRVWVSGARKQGMPEGVLLAFDATWKAACFQTPVVVLQGRIMAWRYINKMVDMVFVAILAPGDDADSDTKDKFYEALHKFLRGVKARCFIVAFGDLNAHLGPQPALPYIEKHAADDQDNNNGERLRELVISHELVVLNRVGRKCGRSRATSTFFGGGSRQGRLLDYAFISKRGYKAVIRPARTDWKTPVRRPGKKDDHRPVCWELRRAMMLPTRRKAGVVDTRHYRQVKWDKKKLAAVVRGAEQAKYQTKEGQDRAESPEVQQLIDEVDQRMQDLTPWPRDTVEDTHQVLNQAVFDGAVEVFELTGEVPEREFLYQDTWRTVTDKTNAVAASMTLCKRAYAPFWLCSALIRHRDMRDFFDEPLLCMLFALRKTIHTENKLDKEAEKLKTRDRIRATERFALSNHILIQNNSHVF